MTRIASPGLRPVAADRAASGRFADQRHAEDQRAVPGVGIAADQVDTEALGQGRHAVVKPACQVAGADSRQGDGNNRGARHPGHGRDI